MAAGYERWWAPVIAPYGRRVLDRVADAVADGATEILDVGAGTGTVAFEAVRRWNGVRVTAIDPSAGMLAVARERAIRELIPAQRRRITFVEASGDRLPHDAAQFDLAVSAFVLQLVPSRRGVLREIRRVLRPGGRIAYVTWLAGGRRFEGDDALDAALDEVGLGAREPETRSGDFASLEAAAGSLRAAGFREARAERGQLAHGWTPAGFAEFVTAYDEQDLFESAEPEVRARLSVRFRARLERLSETELTMRLPLVYATGRRP